MRTGPVRRPSSGRGGGRAGPVPSARRGQVGGDGPFRPSSVGVRRYREAVPGWAGRRGRPRRRPRRWTRPPRVRIRSARNSA